MWNDSVKWNVNIICIINICLTKMCVRVCYGKATNLVTTYRIKLVILIQSLWEINEPEEIEHKNCLLMFRMQMEGKILVDFIWNVRYLVAGRLNTEYYALNALKGYSNISNCINWNSVEVQKNG